MPGDNPHNILIVGNGKSGTTALYFRILNSLPGSACGYFEPNDLHTIKQSSLQPTVTKVLLPIDIDVLLGREPFFQKKILIIRDPRDILISNLLYTGGYHCIWDKSEREIERILKLFVEKEQSPRSVSVHQLFRATRGQSAESLLPAIDTLVNMTLRLADSGLFFIVKYEDFITERLQPLQSYLGIALSENREIDPEFGRVVRTKASGDWKNWFTIEDQDIFEPRLSPFIRRFDYDEGWRLAHTPRIVAKHCSGYLARIINERRRSANLPPLRSSERI